MRIKKIPRKSGWITVCADKGEKYYTESAFWYALKKLLISKGYDVIKRNMEQDGHIMGDKYIFYVRDREWDFCLFDHAYAIRAVNKDFNEDREVTLSYRIGVE